MSGWTCSHQVGSLCDLLNRPCEPGIKGCTLYGKALFADPATPSNEAVARREAMRKQKEQEEEMRRLMEEAKKGF
ncbi:hypothetical protein [Hydrogenimonas sp. SS33]|uniref:hypothetical protein n=1 Tax=Hydrogenimonas leucolamina TaxID=2954236 RepID=UPI00336BAEBD